MSACFENGEVSLSGPRCQSQSRGTAEGEKKAGYSSQIQETFSASLGSKGNETEPGQEGSVP